MGVVVSDFNSIRAITPSFVEYLKNPEDADKYCATSNLKIDCICPKCNSEKQMIISNYKYQGFACDVCSDNISIPEKFVYNLLSSLDLEIYTQKVFDWAKGKRYDFYIPSLNIIVETHGEQHYKDGRGFYKTLQEEQENDLLKYNLAVKNGIKPENYIVIDCRKSEFEWLKEGCIKMLSRHFCLNNVDWNLIMKNCSNSKILDIWEYWNKNIDITTKNVCEKYDIDRSTVISYLKQGNEIGMCKYSTDEETAKNNLRSKNRFSKKVLQLTLDGEIINEFDSAIGASREIKCHHSGIIRCCNDKLKHYKNFIWRYA